MFSDQRHIQVLGVSDRYHFQASLIDSVGQFMPNYQLRLVNNTIYNFMFEGSQSALITHMSSGTLNMTSNFVFDIGYIKNATNLPAYPIADPENIVFPYVEGMYSLSQEVGVINIRQNGFGGILGSVNVVAKNVFTKIYAADTSIVNYIPDSYDATRLHMFSNRYSDVFS